MTQAPESALNRTLAALADPTRRAILTHLAQGPATAGEIAALFPLTQPAISRHLRLLGEAGLILRDRDAQKRPARLAPAALGPVSDFIGGLRTRYETRFNRLDSLLAQMPDDEHAAEHDDHDDHDHNPRSEPGP